MKTKTNISQQIPNKFVVGDFVSIKRYVDSRGTKDPYLPNVAKITKIYRSNSASGIMVKLKPCGQYIFKIELDIHWIDTI
jgi:hypothetical protein